ncbi:MAG: YggS family pyridoxal phosphate-dependent enzyme [Bacteroidetes bacterium]|uniref:YggS family pyridoxal phosphate-dependent enzyme n=1 Tax=Phnomibacter sp. TaxID=2836217 RepID=UPI002FDC7CA1|nr:YggS family pyridoxal phosphate-dependent enzyme [Bacteroidota bacterium]
MSVNTAAYQALMKELQPKGVQLVAVSKTKPVEDIRALYALGQRDFGENYVQELVDKQPQLPSDIRWHFIGHLQSNKVKYIAPFVHLIHGVDSFKLLKEIDKQAVKNNRIIEVLLQMHIAQEETKFGLDDREVDEILNGEELSALKNVRIVGIMSMASFVDDEQQVRKEFLVAKKTFDHYAHHQVANVFMQYLSLGMSADYTIAVECGSNMIRVGSKLFGARS